MTIAADRETGLARQAVELLQDPSACVHLRGAAAGALPLTLEDVAGLLADGRARFPHVALTREGKPLAPAQFCTDRLVNGTPASGLVDAAKLRRELANGASVVLSELETYWPALSGLTKAIADRSGVEVGAMAFLSPPGTGAFPLHQDPVHVIVIHAEGHKHWTVHQSRGADEGAGPVRVPEGDEPVVDVAFGPGDVFSMPPWHPHRATSSEGWALHVSLTARRPDPMRQLRGRIQRAAAALTPRADATADELRDTFVLLLDQQPATDPLPPDSVEATASLVELFGLR